MELIAVGDSENYDSYAKVKVKILSVDGINRKIKYSSVLYLDNPAEKINVGDKLSGLFSAEIPENSLDFNSYTYNKAKGIYVLLSQVGRMTVGKCEKLPLSLLPVKFAHKLREVYSQFLPPDAAAFCSALLTGDKSGIDYTLRDNMSICGISHVLSVSGMHISLLTGFILMLFGRKYGSLICLPIVIVFVPFAGFSPSVIRAAIMNTALIFSFILQRQNDSLSALSAAVFIMLFINPYAVLDMGFALSFGASLGILLFYSRLERLVCSAMPKRLFKIAPVRRFIAKPVISILCSSVAASFFTFPLCALFFGRISVISPFANILIIPFISVLFIFTILLGIAGLFWTLGASVIAIPVKALIYYTVSACALLAKIPFAAFSVQNFYFLITIFIVYLILYLCIRGKLAKLHAAALCAVLISIGIIFSGMSYKNIFNVEILNSGGPAAILRGSSGCFIVDCGSSYKDISSKKIYNHLSTNGITRADALILTQIDDKHAGAAVELLKNNAAKSLFMPYGDYDDFDLARRIYFTAEKYDISVYPLPEQISAGKLNILTHRLTTGDVAAEIKFNKFAMLCAHSDNIFVISKAFSAKGFKFDTVITDYSNLSHKSEFNKFCTSVGAEFVAIPDKIFGSELPVTGAECYYLSRCGDINIKVR